jgi:hypothetical protein
MCGRNAMNGVMTTAHGTSGIGRAGSAVAV